MTGFIAHVPPAAVAAETVDNEPFFPAVATADVRAVARFDGAVTADAMRAAIIAAIIHVNDQLRAWAAEQTAARLKDADGQGVAHADHIGRGVAGGQSQAAERWRRRVSRGCRT